MLTVLDEYSRECLAIVVTRKLQADDVLQTLSELFVEHGPYTEKPDSGCVNTVNRGDFPRVPAPSRSRIELRQRHLHREPNPRSTAKWRGQLSVR